MSKVVSRATTFGRRLRARLARYLPSRGANVAAIVAISLAPLAGVMGMAMEGSNWYFTFRSEQNAADAAVVAAANQALQDYYANNDAWRTASTDPFVNEGKAVAKNFGYVNNGVDTTVTVSTAANCPTGFSNPSGFACFQVTINKTLPLYLTRLVGFTGNSNGKQIITATATSGAVSIPAPVCFTALAHDTSSGNSYSFIDNGQSMNLSGCPVGTNGGAKCSASAGSNLNVPYIVMGNATTDKNNCSGSDVTLPSTDYLTDPYVSLDTSIPTAPACGGSSLTGSSATTTLLSAAGSGTTACPLVHIISGDLTLTAGQTLNVTGDQIWVIQNGVLNMNGATLETGGGVQTGSGGLAIIFTGGQPASIGNGGYIQGAGTLNISSLPKNSGTFSGVTLYQDPRPWGGEPAAGSVYAATYNGASAGQAWDLSGIMYFPNADFTLNGAMDKAGNGYNCFNMVVDTVDVNGGGNQFSLYSTPLAQCNQQGSYSVQTFGYRFALVA